MSRVEIEGLEHLRSGLRGFEAGLKRAEQLAGARAADLIKRSAVPRIPRGPARGGHLASTVKALPSRGEVTEGGAGFPYTAWLDFGGWINRHRQRPNHRSWIHRGRYVWGAVGDNHQEIIDIYEDEIMRAARGRGL